MDKSSLTLGFCEGSEIGEGLIELPLSDSPILKTRRFNHPDCGGSTREDGNGKCGFRFEETNEYAFQREDRLNAMLER